MMVAMIRHPLHGRPLNGEHGTDVGGSVLEPLWRAERAVRQLAMIGPREIAKGRKHKRDVCHGEEGEAADVSAGPFAPEEGAHERAPHIREWNAASGGFALLGGVGGLGERGRGVDLVVGHAESALKLLGIRLVCYFPVPRNLAGPYLRQGPEHGVESA
eukprot:scaffold22995_cov29-Tisochrysis_lutea.AAC.2